MKKREILYILLAIFFIGCGSPSEFKSNVIIQTDDNKSKGTLVGVDGDKSKNLPIETNTTCKPLPKTGQIRVHHVDDDGYLKKGSTRSYTRDSQIVTDNSTGIMWQDSENIKKPWVTQENYISGNYTDTSGDTAATYCKNLTLGEHVDWRLPTSDELYYLSDKGLEKPSIDHAFQNITFDDSYWSSTASKTISKAWYVNFDDGYKEDANKSSNFFVRCVRGENKIIHNFVRDPEKKVVNDTKTCLMWQDGDETTTKIWKDAMIYCNDLSFAGFDDWRVPNIHELNSINDKNKKNTAIKNAFVNTSSYGYWSSTTQAEWAEYAWVIYFDSSGGYTYDQLKSYDYRTRCVRSGE